MTTADTNPTVPGWDCLPVTAGVRTRLLAVLADVHPEHLSTNAIQQRLRERFGCNHVYRREHDDSHYLPDYLPEGCTFGHECPGQCWYTQAYPQLRRLSNLGLIEWHPGMPQTTWRLIDPATDDTLDVHQGPPPMDIVDLDAPARTTAPRRRLMDRRGERTCPSTQNDSRPPLFPRGVR